ncbi:MAG TPA: ArsI/CadI family heavy metal resistance metalloenzyme [Terriglobales bacterium]|nr:ArsI/CadI family heavy metal resistance metalloenzyme [Terriglobales bacterium]
MNARFHLSLDVENLETSVRFYSTLLASPPTKLKPGYAKFDLENPAVNLALQEKSHCCLQGLNHMGLRVQTRDEMLAIKKRLEAAGYETKAEMNTTCCYALQDKFWVNDPSRYRWEVYILKADTEQESASVERSCCA